MIGCVGEGEGEAGCHFDFTLSIVEAQFRRVKNCEHRQAGDAQHASIPFLLYLPFLPPFL
jgi:hypothetical protein